MRIDAAGVTYPAAGVIATSPATAPAVAPTTLGWPLCAHEIVSHVSAAIAAAVVVLTNALAARPFAASALPALKPNQPNHSSAQPSTTIGMSCGSTSSPRRCVMRLPRTQAATSAETPDEMCTTVPPAKSSAPSLPSQPPCPHTQCASGSYTNVAHNRLNRTNALKRLRSANAPLMSAGVMTANINRNPQQA